MKILLIQQHTGQRVISSPLYPIGLSYLAAVLTDHDVRIFDPNVYAYPECLDDLKSEVAGFQPDVVGISIRNVDTTQRKDLFVNFKTVKPTLDAVLEVKPDVKIVAGGTGFSIHAQEIMSTLPEIAYGVYLEGEESFPELLSNLESPEKVKGVFYRNNGEVIFSGARLSPDFEKLPIPRRDGRVIDINRYNGPLHNIVGVQSKRGCVYSCTYCTYMFLNENRVRLRKATHVVDEIEQMVNELGVKGFTFVDSVFNMPESHAREICEEMIRRKINVPWGAWLTPLNISEEFLLLMREAGCRHIGYSPDAVTDRGLAVLQKGFSFDDVERSIQLAKNIKGVAFGYGLFCAYPGITMSEVLKTLYMFFRIPLALPGRGGVWLGWIRVEPYTKIFDTAVREGLIAQDVKMLPENEKELEKLFYVPKNKWFQTLIFDIVLFLVNNVLKPGTKRLFHVLGRLTGHKDKVLYDS
jgi:anaerobic magnesium-protoporphyrin IX monomethyl ester cyclase